MNSRFSALVATLGSLLLVPQARAQYEIKGDVSNVLDGIPLTINQWVDERTYLRNRANKDSGAAPWADERNMTTDWLEARAMDLLADADAGANPEAEDVLRRPARALENWAPPLTIPNSPGWVSSNDAITINLKPSSWFERLDSWSMADPTPSSYHGLTRTVAKRSDSFANLMFHEARHSWQFQPSKNRYTDNDGDFLVTNPPPSSPELTDALYPTNPEFSFVGDDGGTGSNDFVLQPAMWQDAMEHNADRFAKRQLGGSLTCARDYLVTAAPDPTSGAMVVSATYLGDGNREQGQQKLTGRLVKIETAPSCDPSTWPPSTSWTPLPNNFTTCFGTGRPCATDGQGKLAIPNLPGGQSYRFTLINPAECSAQEVSTCVAIP